MMQGKNWLLQIVLDMWTVTHTQRHKDTHTQTFMHMHTHKKVVINFEWFLTLNFKHKICSSVILFPVVATHLIFNQGCAGICFLCSHLCFGLITSTCCSCSSYEISWWTNHSVVSGEHKVCPFPSRVLSNICFMDLSIQFQYPAD